MSVSLFVEPTVSAPALRLRPWQGEDAGDLVAAHRDPLLRRWLTTHLDSEADARRWIDDQCEAWATGVRLSFAVLECQGAENYAGRPVGHIVVKGGSDPTKTSAEVGYWTSTQARGRAIAPRALEAVSAWVLGPQRVMPVTRLDLLHASGNHGSCRVADKCQYVLRAVLPAQLPAFPTEGHLHVRPGRGA
ncbi:GNAT family N-acetyltransferase [Streptomyces sp. NBC_01003]|uniref:GNAT family N-acetyltransferase n=1 Tax=Streptomyces sp. NBC_01003 TaxID=2903714 RepID=UPI003862F661|nr:GNAT family N-acetyltransferase [Streptomyces sp. NBC_01003]